MKGLILTLSLLTILCCKTPPSIYQLELNDYRKSHLDELVQHERAPLKATDLADVRFFDTDEHYVLEAQITTLSSPDTFDMATYSGMKKPYYTFATASFKLNDQSETLEIYKSIRLSANPEYSDYIFLPFKDHTNGEETYGRGRYIDLLQSNIKDGKLLIDFNKCYNPWCAYSDGFNCPIPPKANHLDLPIAAGEMMYTGKKGK